MLCLTKQPQQIVRNSMPENDIDAPRLIPVNAILLGALAAITVFMMWCGFSNIPLPEWVYWISTLL